MASVGVYEKVVGKGRRDPLQRVREHDVPHCTTPRPPIGTSCSLSRWGCTVASFHMFALIYKHFIHPPLWCMCQACCSIERQGRVDSGEQTWEYKQHREQGIVMAGFCYPCHCSECCGFRYLPPVV